METWLSLKTEDVICGLRSYGYLVTVKPVPGREQGYYETLRDALQRVESTVELLNHHFRCRGKSKRTLWLLHRNLYEPCWGVTAPVAPSHGGAG